MVSCISTFVCFLVLGTSLPELHQTGSKSERQEFEESGKKKEIILPFSQGKEGQPKKGIIAPFPLPNQNAAPTRVVLVVDRSQSLMQKHKIKVVVPGKKKLQTRAITNRMKMQTAIDAFLQTPQAKKLQMSVVIFANRRQIPLGNVFIMNPGKIRAEIDQGLQGSAPYDTKIWSATSDAIQLLLNTRPKGFGGQDHIIVFSDGKPEKETEDLANLIASANRNDIQVHNVVFQGNKRFSSSDRQNITALSSRTGGNIVFIDSHHVADISQAMAALAKNIK